jgi:hypothetical protein
MNEDMIPEDPRSSLVNNNYTGMMGSPQDPADHPANNLASNNQVPLQNSGQSFAAQAMDVAHTGDIAKKLGSKYKVSKGRKK